MVYGFIGVGRMGGAILKGLLGKQAVSPDDVWIIGRDPAKTEKKAAELGVKTAGSHAALAAAADVIFLGVEPGTVPEVLERIRDSLTDDKLLISMAAGVTIRSITDVVGESRKVIRIMPNAPARVGEMMASASRNGNVGDGDMAFALKLLSALGRAEELPEDQIDAVIGVSGSSPAYTYMYIKALADGAAERGMDPGKARIFAAQAVKGAAQLVLDTDQDLADLIDSVATPGGTTIEAVKYLGDNGFETIVKGGENAAIDKSVSMSKKDE